MHNEQITRLLQDLVRIPSVNPVGDPGTVAKNTGEARISEFVADFLRKLALDVEFHEVEPGRANVVGKFTSRGGKRSIALEPHTDTVSVAGMSIDPFGGDVRDGRLYGRGASDTKGSMAAMLSALANVVRRKDFREGDLDIYFCALMGEESGNDGARALMKRGFKADFAIAGEPTDCRIVHAHKGALWFKIITRGKSTHGATPDQGESAILKMSEVVRYLLGDYAATLRGKAATLLGAPTVNVGTIRGGAQTNIVPDYCEVDIDRRTLPGEDHGEILADLRAALSHVPIEIENVRDCHPMHTDPQNPFVQRLVAACSNPESRVPNPAPLIGVPWYSDAALFAENGVPAVAFGPGSIAQAHTKDEFIELGEVFRAAQILERFLATSASS